MVVRQAVNVLRCYEHFAAARMPVTLTQLSDALSLPLSSTSNLVKTLREFGYLFEVRKRGGFYPTRKMNDLCGSILEADPILGRIRTHMLALRDATGETVLLAGRSGDQVVYLETCESTQAVRYAARPGEFRPVYAVSGGKAILSLQTDAALRSDLKQMDFSNAASTSISDPRRLFANIVEGRARGWFLNATEFTPDVSGIGMTLNIAGQHFGLSVAGPNFRIEGRHEAIAAAIRATLDAVADGVNHPGTGS